MNPNLTRRYCLLRLMGLMEQQRQTASELKAIRNVLAMEPGVELWASRRSDEIVSRALETRKETARMYDLLEELGVPQKVALAFLETHEALYHQSITTFDTRPFEELLETAAMLNNIHLES